MHRPMTVRTVRITGYAVVTCPKITSNVHQNRSRLVQVSSVDSQANDEEFVLFVAGDHPTMVSKICFQILPARPANTRSCKSSKPNSHHLFHLPPRRSVELSRLLHLHLLHARLIQQAPAHAPHLVAACAWPPERHRARPNRYHHGSFRRGKCCRCHGSLQNMRVVEEVIRMNAQRNGQSAKAG